MEKIYDPCAFRSSEHIDVKEYFKEYGKVCHFKDDETADIIGGSRNVPKSNFLKQKMNVGGCNIEALEEACSLNKLTVTDEPDYMPVNVPEKIQTRTQIEQTYPVNESAKQLNVIMCKQILDQRYDLSSGFKFGSKRFLKTATVTSNTSRLCDILPGSDFIYTIIVYRPFSINYGYRNSGEKLRFAYEIEALGTNTLTELADTIVCVANIALFKEVENTSVDLGPFMRAKEHYPSQSIFIDGVFYNDTRSHKAIDYSFKVIEWANEKGIGKFKSEKMEKALLNSLKPRLGFPYVYMHQGNCEHIFTFSDARLVQPSDCLSSRKYPRVVSISRTSNIICFICGVLHSQWIVMNCSKFPQEKVFLCTGCCNSYLFIDGKKVVDFNLYPYYDEELLTRHLNADIVE